MKIQNMIKKITIAVLSAAMMLAPIVNIKAASTDVVDTSKTGSITIHKYDMTAAKQAGVNTSQLHQQETGRCYGSSLGKICDQRCGI